MDQETSGSKVIFGKKGYEDINSQISEKNYSKIFVLVDTHTHEQCLPLFLSKIETSSQIEIVEVEPGEESKSILTSEAIWKTLSELDADRKSVLINLGGGVVTDLGGFVAATFKRGISFINVPTTLLAMVDAAVGGKTGVNLGALKNQVGVIKEAELVLIDTEYLSTLPTEEIRSGLAEMLKHGLIRNEDYWKKIIDLKDLQVAGLDGLIEESIKIKERIVTEDPRENSLRKTLNYGHTLGHALETYFLDTPRKKKLLHGEAVAAGMIMATYLSSAQLEFPKEKLKEVCYSLHKLYGKIDLKKEEFYKVKDLLKFDKKNENGNINFVLLKDIGQPVIDCQVSDELLDEALSYYLNFN